MWVINIKQSTDSIDTDDEEYRLQRSGVTSYHQYC